jgi:hypothetical protein
MHYVFLLTPLRISAMHFKYFSALFYDLNQFNFAVINF